MATAIATGSGAEAIVTIEKGNPVTWNDPALTARVLPSLQRAVGASKVVEARPTTTAEDFDEDPDLADRYRLLDEINRVINQPL